MKSFSVMQQHRLERRHQCGRQPEQTRLEKLIILWILTLMIQLTIQVLIKQSWKVSYMKIFPEIQPRRQRQRCFLWSHIDDFAAN